MPFLTWHFKYYFNEIFLQNIIKINNKFEYENIKVIVIYFKLVISDNPKSELFINCFNERYSRKILVLSITNVSLIFFTAFYTFQFDSLINLESRAWNGIESNNMPNRIRERESERFDNSQFIKIFSKRREKNIQHLFSSNISWARLVCSLGVCLPSLAFRRVYLWYKVTALPFIAWMVAPRVAPRCPVFPFGT